MMPFSSFPTNDDLARGRKRTPADPVADKPIPGHQAPVDDIGIPDTPIPDSPPPADPVPADPLPSPLMTDDATHGFTPEEQEPIGAALSRIAALPDPSARAIGAAQAIDVFDAAERVARKIRRRAIAELLTSGKGTAAVARLTGVSESTVKVVKASLVED